MTPAFFSRKPESLGGEEAGEQACERPCEAAAKGEGDLRRKDSSRCESGSEFGVVNEILDMFPLDPASNREQEEQDLGNQTPDRVTSSPAGMLQGERSGFDDQR